jgi:hypothetical protein
MLATIIGGILLVLLGLYLALNAFGIIVNILGWLIFIGAVLWIISVVWDRRGTGTRL